MMDVTERILPGSLLWVPSEKGSFQLGEVQRRNGSMLKVILRETGTSFSLDLDDPDIAVLKANKEIVPDMTRLQHLHLPGILYNLRKRATTDEPYTFLGGSVLVAVNPLKKIKDPKGLLGSQKAITTPHPYALAEGAYQQMRFAAGRKTSETPVNQSILVSGESGAGKTESSKMVLKHLVHRCLDGSKDDNDLDKRLLDSNPILESFGNAATKRNHNSSRFGKFLKLHFETARGKREKFQIFGASVETYLLERSRVTAHSEGERGFHVFYQLIAGATKSQRATMELEHPFKYLQPKKREDSSRRKAARGMKRSKSIRLSFNKLEGEDKSNFKHLSSALETIGISKTDANKVSQDQLFGVLAAVLHLGNVEFHDDSSTTAGHVATVEDTYNLDKAAELLGVKSKHLLKLFVERKVKTVGEEIITKRDAQGAKDALDAVVKAIYMRLFDWLVKKISESLGGGRKSSSSAATPTKGSGKCFIGVLDIFGFEAFTVNDFEQLLINYTNEALQSSFNRQIFEAEAALYEQEGLLVSEKDREPPLDNKACMDLLRGIKSSRNSKNSSKGAMGKQLGVLGLIDAEGKSPQPLDEKMNAALHRAFKGHVNFPTPHPRDVRTCFIIKHFAGKVKYTVGNFLEKNSDKLPPEVDALFFQSSERLVTKLFGNSDKSAIATAKRTVRAINNSIVSKFKSQIDTLINTLDQTRCSFIRCVKPNPHMLREENESWFDDGYITNQLENLSIPQTTQVLSGGLPTRIPFDVFVDSYSQVLPPKAIQVWKTLGQGDDRAFVSALFYAFSVPSDTYKLGLSLVFFKAGMLEELTEVLDAATSGKINSNVVDRFRSSFARHLWRKAYAKVLAVNKFLYLFEMSKSRNGAVTILQRLARRKLAEVEAKAELARLREEKRKKQEIEAKKRAKEARRKQKELKKAAAEAAAKKQKHAEMLRLEEAQQAKRAKEEEEKARKATEEQNRVKEYRIKVEKEEKAMRKKEKEETKKAIERCGGEQGYLAQKKRERAIRFNDSVKVQEYQMYLTDENMEPPGSHRVSFSDERVQSDDLANIASSVQVISLPPEKLPAHMRAPEPTDSRSKGKGQAPARRRSYAPSPLESGYVDDARDENLSCTQVSFAIDNPAARYQPKKRSTSLACLLGVGGGGGSRRKKKRNSTHPYDWSPCFAAIRGIKLEYFQDFIKNRDSQDYEGVERLGCFDIPSTKEIFRFPDATADPRLAADAETNPKCVLKLLHVDGASLLLRFKEESEANLWSRTLDKALRRWKEEIEAVQRFDRGKLSKEDMKTYKDLLSKGIISKEEYQDALGQQISTAEEYVTQEVAIYGEESYDKRVQCSECQEINFLLEKDDDGAFWCHECGTELTLDGSPVATVIPSLLQMNEEDENNDNFLFGLTRYPVSVPQPDGTILTVFQGELIGRPRFDVKTQERQYYFSFRCQYEDKRNKKSTRYWSIDFPYPSFKFLHQAMGEDLDRRGFHDIQLPDFPADSSRRDDDPKEQARARLKDLNFFMEELLILAQQKPQLFRCDPLRYFFNLKANMQVAPLGLGDLQDLKKSMNALSDFSSGGKKLNKQIMSLYKSIQCLFSRIEAAADEGIVFTTTDPLISGLSLQQKGEIFSIAQDYLLILESFEQRVQDLNRKNKQKGEKEFSLY